MNEMLKGCRASGDLLVESKFETPETAFVGGRAFSTQFAGRLRRIFEPPAAHTESDAIAVLVRQINRRLERRR